MFSFIYWAGCHLTGMLLPAFMSAEIAVQFQLIDCLVNMRERGALYHTGPSAKARAPKCKIESTEMLKLCSLQLGGTKEGEYSAMIKGLVVSIGLF